MRVIMLGLAAAAAALALSGPAQAGESFIPDHVSVAAPASPLSGGSGGSGRRGGGGGLGVWVNGGEWALYNNQSWQSDGFNDWWHDRPDRAYPAWMRNNQNCARQWYAGSTLRC